MKSTVIHFCFEKRRQHSSIFKWLWEFWVCIHVGRFFENFKESLVLVLQKKFAESRNPLVLVISTTSKNWLFSWKNRQRTNSKGTFQFLQNFRLWFSLIFSEEIIQYSRTFAPQVQNKCMEPSPCTPPCRKSFPETSKTWSETSQ